MPDQPQAPADAIASKLLARAPASWLPYIRLMRLDRPIGTWLLFWPCAFGLILGAGAESRPFGEPRDLWYLGLMAVGAIVMRGAGCTFNDIVDRKIDAAVARTAARPIPSGAVSVKRAAIFMAAQCLVGLAILLQFNLPAILLGIGSLLLVAAYPFMKRITWWPQAWLGLTFNWGAVLAFAAVTGTVDIADAMLYAGLFFWTLGYDTIYAHQDKEFDELIGVKSTARRLGTRSREWILGFYGAAFTLILAAGFTEHTGWTYVFFMLAAGGHLLWQVRTLKIDDAANCQDPAETHREDAANCLNLFRANRDTGALIGLALLVSTWIG